MTDVRRALPSVDRLLREPGIQALIGPAPRNVVVAAVRDALEAARSEGRAPADWPAAVAGRVHQRVARSLQPVLNATGVVLHTNLGRAPLAATAIEAITQVGAGYSTLEYDLASGERGSRHDHCTGLLAELTGADAALVVNNAAAALVLALNALAEGKAVVISRGELIEIGGSFRIPDILGKSGAQLREVGTTNRTHLADYADALDQDAGAVLAVHRSNFEQRGFVAAPQPAALAELAHANRLPFIYDVGSGLLADLSPWGLVTEPRVGPAVATGADLVVFSGDKLLGGPQAGCLVGRAAAVDACRRNPIARAARADKLTLAALEATLALYLDPGRAIREIPVLRMLSADPADLRVRAADLAGRMPAWCRAELVDGESAAGGGSFPGARLPTTLVAVSPGDQGADALARRLRLGAPPVVARVAEGRILFDPRTLPPAAHEAVSLAVAAAGG